ncbi:hypothetical protein ON010_g8081 [Phytophthora cinnamomi]|nr:hypothetical protein ON010_g8081 [Phytophthora cinnamomi]
MLRTLRPSRVAASMAVTKAIGENGDSNRASHLHHCAILATTNSFSSALAPVQTRQPLAKWRCIRHVQHQQHPPAALLQPASPIVDSASHVACASSVAHFTLGQTRNSVILCARFPPIGALHGSIGQWHPPPPRNILAGRLIPRQRPRRATIIPARSPLRPLARRKKREHSTPKPRASSDRQRRGRLRRETAGDPAAVRTQPAAAVAVAAAAEQQQQQQQ